MNKLTTLIIKLHEGR